MGEGRGKLRREEVKKGRRGLGIGYWGIGGILNIEQRITHLRVLPVSPVFMIRGKNPKTTPSSLRIYSGVPGHP
jgi:hypothetical protein